MENANNLFGMRAGNLGDGQAIQHGLEIKMFEDFVETVRGPILALDCDLRVVKANRGFCDCFKVTPEDTNGKLLCVLGNSQREIPALRKLLETLHLNDSKFFIYVAQTIVARRFPKRVGEVLAEVQP